MEAQELRIGNWVNFGDSPLIVDINVLKDLDVYNQQKIKPIPITEEWLVKLGFEEYIDFGEKTGCFDKTPLCGFSYSVNSDKVSIIEKGNHISHWIEREIKYVHELQNLYFSIKGEELTIKP